jgi:NAD(P)-dependent dehydrogenase (short-subunit alcohol dehydrogenase family)
VTGASRGLGLEFVRQLLVRGDSVLAACRRPAEAADLDGLALEHPGRLRVLPLDVSSASSRAALCAALGAGTAIDLLVQNAGVLDRDERLGALQASTFRDAFETNALGPLLLAEALMPFLQAGHRPSVAFLSSQLGSIGRTERFYTPSYAMAKAALNMAARLLAEPLHEAGVAGVLLHPGWVRTAMGGPQAPLEPPEAVAGLLAVIDALPRDGAMRFLDYRGEELPW